MPTCWCVEAVWPQAANKIQSPITSVRVEGVVAETKIQAGVAFMNLFSAHSNGKLKIVSIKPQS